MENLSINREKIGKIASIVGILANMLLACAKILVGALFGALSVLADGLNNLTDCGSSVMSLISFKLSNKPADKEHPFGHERIEYILSMIVAFIILIISFELFKEGFNKILSPVQMEFSLVVILVLIGSILIKLALFFYNKITAEKINSNILKATSIDNFTDCISTFTVLVAMLINKFFNLNLDGYASVLVAIFIAISGIGVLKETMSHLIGQAPDKELVDMIKEKILSHEEVLGIHDLSVYCYGPNKYFASVHVEVDSSVDVMISHELVDQIEQEFFEQTNILLTGHLDPIAVNDEEVNKLKEITTYYLKEINNEFTLHDFRIVKGPNNTNLIFDVAVPYENKLTDSEIKQRLTEKINELKGSYKLVIKIEKQTL